LKSLFYYYRPDPRQEFLLEWQLDYNSTNYELRSDDEAKCELHQKWADLWVRIEEVTVERKEENTKMRVQLLHNSFLKEKIEAIGKHFFQVRTILVLFPIQDILDLPS
jgi:hypothetical protein